MARGRHRIISIGRDARNGRFLSVKAARRRKASAVVERIRNVPPPRKR